MTSETILAIIGFIFGTGGVGTGIFYLKQNRRLKKNEADSAQYDAESKFIDNTNKAVDIYKEAIEFQKNRTAEIEEFHQSRYERLSETMSVYKSQVEEFKNDSENNRKKIRALSIKVNSLERKIDNDKGFICYNTLCKTRQHENYEANK